jgi:enamine deaminase RidA (YjgF/YER057c/UK114 family)
MTLKDVVKTTVFLTSAGDIEGFRKVRGQRLGDNAPASTLVIITQLARPEFKVEVEAIASKDA